MEYETFEIVRRREGCCLGTFYVVISECQIPDRFKDGQEVKLVVTCAHKRTISVEGRGVVCDDCNKHLTSDQ